MTNIIIYINNILHFIIIVGDNDEVEAWMDISTFHTHNCECSCKGSAKSEQNNYVLGQFIRAMLVHLGIFANIEVYMGFHL